MKAEIELSYYMGGPILKIKHYYESSSLDQLVLGEFLAKAGKEGLYINTTGELLSDNESYEIYEIRIKPN